MGGHELEGASRTRGSNRANHHPVMCPHAERRSKTFSIPNFIANESFPMSQKAPDASDGLLLGHKETIASLVDYQPRSVVSCTIIHHRAGTVTLFAFDEGEGLSEHTAPYNALVHLIEGEAEVTISGNTSLLEQGEAIILPAGMPHAVKATKRFKMLLTMISTK
jgi:quercetin dioxygenase-like cupin family protein